MLRMRKLVTNRWVHVYRGVISRGRNGGGYGATGIAICVQHFAFLVLVDDNIFFFKKY